MKFRTDFVTNSSSESFFTVFTKHTDGSEKGYFGEDGQVFSKWAGTVQKEDGIYINEARISNKEELCAILLFGNNDEFEAMPLKALSALFLFLSEEIDCSELIERIQLLENTLDWSRYYYDGIRKTLGESYDFSILKEIDTESDDKEDIASQIMEIFGNDYEEIDEDRFDEVQDLYRDESIAFEKISIVEISELDTERGEFMNTFTDPLEESHKENEFPQITEDDPLFEKECNRWTKHVKDIFGREGLQDIYTESALSAGNYYRLCDDSIGNAREIYEYFYPNGVNKCLDSFCSSGKIPDKQFEKSENNHPNLLDRSLKLPPGIKQIGRYAFKNSGLGKILLQNEINEIGAFAFDGTNCKFSEVPKNVNRIGVTLVNDLLEYAVINKFLVVEEADLFHLLDCELDQYGPETDKNPYYSENPNPKALRLLTENGYIYKNFTHYPITDLLEKAIKLGANEYIDLLLKTGLELDFADVAHYIYNDTLETLYPLFDKGLKIDCSSFDDLINYASEQGKPEYTAWLLDQKNKAEVN